jgi:uncharacterized damage-inducible protein DinB
MVDPALTARPAPPFAAAEREMLASWLDFHRATLARKCDGLTDEQLRQRSAPPSALSLLGLVRHMAEVERGWFRQVLAGEQVSGIYETRRNPDAAFSEAATADVAEAFAAWSAECDLARQAEAACPSPDTPAAALTGRGSQVTMRWIMVHMIEEYARHNGHADLLRERIDGATGD